MTYIHPQIPKKWYILVNARAHNSQRTNNLPLSSTPLFTKHSDILAFDYQRIVATYRESSLHLCYNTMIFRKKSLLLQSKYLQQITLHINQTNNTL